MIKEKSLLQNYIFNLIKTLNSILFPVITFAYSSRILGVDGIGKINFAKSVITYFTMIAMLGMNYYGTREAAKIREDKEALSRFCEEMLMINGCTTLLAYMLLVASMICIPMLHEYTTLLLISSIAMILQGMGMEWLYQALEEYRYIAIRSVLFQIGALIAMFVFVREESDIISYTVISLIASVGSYVLNFINIRKYINFRLYVHLEIRKHIKSLLWLFAMTVSVELYTVLDTTMLGFLKGDTPVGLYTAAIKVERIVNTLITSIGVVLIPRLSFYVGQGEYKRTIELVKKAYNYVFMFSIPASVGLFLLSDEIIFLLSGNQFIPAGFTMRILTPIVIFIPFSIMTNQQTFIPLGKEKLILLSTSIGALTNIILNSVLIPRYSENGAAVATVIAEVAVATVCFASARKYFDMKEIFKSIWQYCAGAILIPIPVLFIKKISKHYIIHMIYGFGVSVSLYFFFLFLVKNQYTLEMFSLIKKKFVIGKGKNYG